MKTTLSKVKPAFLLTLIAAIIVCVSFAFAGIFGVKGTASADSVPADTISADDAAETEVTAEKDEAASDNDADGSGATDNATVTINGKTYTYGSSFTLGSTSCAGQASAWNNAISYAVTSTNYTYIKLTQDWIAASVSGNFGGTPQRTSFTGSLDGSYAQDNKYFYHGSIAVSGKIILDLNGHTINRNLTAPTDDGYVFYFTDLYNHTGDGVRHPSELIICDSSNGKGTITGGYHGRGSGDYIMGHGGGIYLNYGGKLTLDGGTIKGNKAEYGGGVYVYDGTFTMNGGSIEGNEAVTNSGGGVYVSGCTFIMNGGIITNNVARGREGGDYDGGGGVYSNGTSANFTMTGGTITKNISTYGGGIHYHGGKATISGGTISYNTASGNGGGIYAHSALTLAGVNVVNNTASLGAGIYGYSAVTISGANISNNTATGAQGGGVYSRGAFSITGGAISKNTATQSGGAVYGASTVSISGGSISENRVTTTNSTAGYGGAVQSVGAFTMSNGSVSGNNGGFRGGILALNTAEISGGTISGNTGSYGGGVCSENTFTMRGGTISGNTASGSGGGVYGAKSVVIYGGVITQNTCTSTGTSGTSSGGGVCSQSTFTMSGGEISYNTSNSYGGGVRSNGTVNITGGTISYNKALTGNGLGGGIIVMSSGTISGANIVGNTSAASGGGVYSNGNITLSNNVNISNNTATGYGGGVYVYGASTTLTLNSGTVSGNTCNGAGYGGGICTNGNFTMTGGSVSNNNSVTQGGGVWVGKISNISGGAITGNSTVEYGGGLYGRGAVNISGKADISGNTAGRSDNNSGEGGGVYAVGTFTMTGGTISNNVSFNYGSGIYGEDSAKVSGGEISGNSGYYGGGIYASGSFTMDGGHINGNTVSGGGGGVYVDSEFTLKGGTISGNTSGDEGGGIFAWNVSSISGGTISGNVSSSYGGGIYIGNMSGSITGGTIAYNEATKAGGGLYYHGDAIKISGITFTGNTASDEQGGAIYIQNSASTTAAGYSVEILNCNFSNNCANSGGGAVYIKSNLRNVYLKNNTFTDNELNNTSNNNGAILELEGNSATATNNPQLTLSNNTYSGYSNYEQLSCKFWSDVSLDGEVVNGNRYEGIIFENCPKVRMLRCIIRNAADEAAIKYNAADSTYSLIMSDCTVEANYCGGLAIVGSTDNVQLEGGTYITSGDVPVIETSGELKVSGAIKLLGHNGIDAYSASILNVVGSLRESYDGSGYGAASIDLGVTKGVLTKGYGSHNDNQSPSKYFSSTRDYGVWLLNGEVFVGAQPTLTWRYRTEGGTYTETTNTSVSVEYAAKKWEIDATYSLPDGTTMGTSFPGGLLRDPFHVGEYNFDGTSSTTEFANPKFTLTIRQKAISAVSGVKVVTKTYDGTTTATLDVSGATFTGRLGTDTLTLGYSSATFADANAGANKAVTVSGLSLGGTSAKNYTLSVSSLSLTGTINKYKTAVNWTNTALEYTGSAQGPKATYKTYDGTETTLTVGGTNATATNAGSYTASVTAPANYEFSNLTCNWRIAPKKINLTWGSTVSFEYNGEEQAPTATYSEDETLTIDVKGAVDVGTDLLAFAVITDGDMVDNYSILNPSKHFTITAKSVDINWVGENGNQDWTYTFNGTKQCPTAYFTDVNNNKVYFEVSGAETNASATAYTASITDAETAKYGNYTFTGDKTKSFTINPLSVSVVWENTSFTYTGEAQNPSASYIDMSGTKVALELESSLMNNKNVGEYTAQVKAPTNTNYQVTQESKAIKFYITKADPKVTPAYTNDSNLKVGMAMPTIATTDGDTAGTISWITKELTLGTNDYSWIFIPTDTANYNVVTGTKSLTVADADGATLSEIVASFNQTKSLETTTSLDDIANFGTLTVQEVYSDGSKKAVTEGYTLAAPEGGLKSGANDITVTYKVGEGENEKTYTATFTVFVAEEKEEATLSGISASFAQEKTILTTAEFKDLLTYGKLTVEEVYSDGSKKAIEASAYTLSMGTDNKFAEGLNTVTVTYKVGEGDEAKTYTATFTVFAQATAKTVVVIVIDNKSSVVGTALEELTYTILSGNAEFAEGDIVLTKAEGNTVGTYAITGEYKGEDYEVKFVDGTYTITANPAAKQVTVVINNKTSVYGDAIVSDLDYTVIGLEDGETLTGITLEKAEGTDAGEYAITGKYEGSNAYNVVFIDGVYTITPKNVTVAIDNKTTREGETIADLTYKVIGLADGEELDGTIKLTTAADANTPNEYAITGTYDGTNYSITWVEGTYTVVMGVPEGTVIIIVDNKTSEYGEVEASLTFTVVDDSVTVAEVENDLTLTKSEGTDVGEYKISATYTGELTVKIIEGTYTITPKVVKVQIDSKSSFKGAELAQLTSNAPSELAEHITLTTEATGLTAGEFAITGSYDGSNNYDVQFINGVYTVKEVTSDVTHVVVVIDNKTSTVGDALVEFTYTTIGLESGEEMTDIELTSTANKDEVGVYAITGKYTGTGNFVVVFVDGTYTVTAKAVPDVKLSAKQIGEIFANTTDFDGKLEFTLTVNGTASTLTDYTLTADLENDAVTVEFEVDGEKYTETVSVFVTPKAVTGISVDYTQGSDKITPNTSKDDIPVKVYVSYNDGTTEQIEKGNYTVDGTLVEGTSKLIVTYTTGGKTFTSTFTVNVDPLNDGEVTKTAIQWENFTFSFDGNEHAPYAYYTINGGAQKVALKLIITGDNVTDGKAIKAGTYTATIDESAAIVSGYELQGDKYHDFVIKEAEIVIEWTNAEASFDGDAHMPTYKVTSTVDDGQVGMKFEIVPKAGSSVTADGKAVNAGEYVAKVVIMDGENYTVKGDLEFEFSIGKSKISNLPATDVDESKEFETLGDAIAYVEEKYEGRKVTVTGTQNADGEYVVTVSLEDDVNYEWTEGVAPQSFKFGASVIIPDAPEEDGVSSVLITALVAAMVFVAFVALIAFIIMLRKSKVRNDDGGFYEAYNG